jgi:hypothetical protein
VPEHKQIRVPKDIRKIDPPLGRLFFTSPKTGDQLVAGREFVIQWSTEGYVPEKCVKIELTQIPLTPAEPTTLDEDKLKLNVTIINQQGGRAVPSQARITFTRYDSTTPEFTKIFDVPALNSGERYRYSMPWPPGISLSPGGFSFQVDVDITNVADEHSEANNHYDKHVLVQGRPNLIVCVGRSQPVSLWPDGGSRGIRNT